MQQGNIKCAMCIVHIVHNVHYVDHWRLLSSCRCWCWCRTPRDPQPASAQHHLTPPRAAGSARAAVGLLILTKGDTWIVIYFTSLTVLSSFISFSPDLLCLRIISKFIKLFFETYSDMWFTFLIYHSSFFFLETSSFCEYIWRRNASLAKDRDWPPHLLSCAGCRVTTTGARCGLLLSLLGHSTQWWLMGWPAALCLQMSWTGA